VGLDVFPCGRDKLTPGRTHHSSFVGFFFFSPPLKRHGGIFLVESTGDDRKRIFAPLNSETNRIPFLKLIGTFLASSAHVYLDVRLSNSIPVISQFFGFLTFIFCPRRC
jgi:hypothetical protein